MEIIESKIPENVLESPVTVTKLDKKKIEQLPQENFYSGLASQKGIDISTSSLFYQSINMRGPSNPVSESVLQLMDGMDNTPPGQGFTIGNLAGVNDLDLESVEIIPGSSSAIYGANAFSGLINMTSKSPFLYRGLSAQLKTGVTYIDGKNHSPALFNDYQLRYAKAWKEKIAAKFNISYQRGTDWINLDQTDWDPNATDEIRGPNNPGHDLFNVYGDEIQQTLLLGPDNSEVNVSRTGYKSYEVFGSKTDDLKLGLSLHYKFKGSSELSYQFNYSLFNTEANPATWNFKKFSVTYHKVELKNKNYFIRCYNIEDHDGHSYEAINVAQSLIQKWKSDSAWFSDYQNAFNDKVAGVIPYDHQLARNYADAGMPQPGSETFTRLVDEFSSISLHDEDGARYEDRTNLQHVHAQYDFSSLFSWMKIISGVEFRSRNLWSDGTLFLDYPPAHYLNTKTYSGYVQCEKDFFKDKLTLLGSARIDKYDVFETNVTPRIAAVYKLNKKNFIRASFQTGARSPDPFDEYRDSHNGIYYIVGGLALSDEKYSLHKRSFELNSLLDYSNAVGSYLEQYGPDSMNAAIERYKNLLKPNDLEYVHPEKVKTVEIGYQRLLFDSKLHLDIDFFGSIYKDLIAYQWVALTNQGNPNDPDSIRAAAADIVSGNVLGFNVPVNAKEEVRSGGVEAGIEYNFWRGYFISGNFIYQKTSKRDPDIDSWLFQTPPIKTNLSISNPNCWKNFGFAVNWHWTDAMTNYWSRFTIKINNQIHANSILDAQVTIQLPKLKSSVRIGASNFLNHYYQNIAYGSSIGGVYYFSILYNGK